MSQIANLPSNDPAAFGLVASREQEQLSYRSMSFDLQLADNRGREVSLSLSMEQLNYSRTYDRLGVIASTGGSSGSGIVDKIRSFAGEQAAEQFRAMAEGRGMLTVAEHEEVELSASSFSLEIDGDMSLLEDYFNAPNTAQRIFDFTTGLGAGLAADSEGFGDFMSQIRQGISDGFAMVEDMLGPLPEVSEQTRELLSLMLDAFEADPTAPAPNAIDLYQEMIDDSTEG